MNQLFDEYEVWEDDGEITLSTRENIGSLKEKKLLGIKAKKIHSFSASTPEEASAIYNLRMGFEPYKPMGEPKLCPNGCGSYFYPESSSICAYCGKI